MRGVPAESRRNTDLTATRLANAGLVSASAAISKDQTLRAFCGARFSFGANPIISSHR
jgi:hypothetical protein